ncbi:MAG TPA: DinB family protein [Bryobacteraceae bacterium]|nr:DinB family protein [Bryobacteraceae bacterium]
MPEAWLRGPWPQVHPMLAPALYTFQQTREDLARHTAGLTAGQVWARPHGLAPAGFHLRHIAGSVDRLTAYLEGRSLDAAQMSALAKEMEPGASLAELLADVYLVLLRAEEIIRAIDPATLTEPRWVGRKRLPTTVIGLLVHIAEHTQRHLGQAIAAAQLARACGGDSGPNWPR